MITNALNQQKQYSYTVDDRLATITYVNGMNSTPNVSFTYDTFSRGSFR
jgi:hypothetical protein